MSWADMADGALNTCIEIFKTDVKYLPSSGGSQPLRGVFDSAYLSLTVQNGVEYSTIGPALGVRLADFGSPPVQGEQVIINSAKYQVTDVQPDGQGGALLVLQKVLKQ